ncbi:MAG: RelA/SpoT family protein [Candidatus Gracilibacteria bacterium]|nr:RelA/SpoT family protein [Candidatus Gracilibacteria bacterium]
MTKEIPTTTDYFHINMLVKSIIDEVAQYMKNTPKEVIAEEIQKAYIYARNAHEGQMRKSGDPYILHPVEATRELLILRPDIVTIQSCLLHDVPEDTDKTVEDIRAVFGDEVAYITAGMEKLSNLKYRGEERTIGSLRKMFIAMSEDVRVIFVKLADRLHNMKTIEFHPNKEKRERIALETLNVYAPIADRLGIFDFKEALETECFKILYPEEYNRIKEELSVFKEAQEIFVTKVKQLIIDTMPEGVPIVDISYRVKSPWSIYKKMQRKGYERVQDLYDLFALRIITDSVHHCYDILGTIHTIWTPVPKRFKDYIALPKENGYQSLHTTVVGIFHEFRSQPTEIQIRTLAMHRQAEIGVAAHFAYSETGQSKTAKDAYWAAELKEILDNSEDSDFMTQMKIGVFDDRIFAFTPRGQIQVLPKGSTPVDFAYSVHSDLGDHIAVARVNGRVVPLDYELRNGESVEIVMDKNRNPSITWLSFVKTTRARESIKAYSNRTNRDQLIEKGRFILNAHLLKHFNKTLDKDLSLLKIIDGKTLDTEGRENVLVQLGNLSRKPSSVTRSMLENSSSELHKLKELGEQVKKEKKIPGPKSEGISLELIIGGEKHIPYRFAHCCEPKVGDKVVGYITRNGVNIHKIDCTSLRQKDFDRYIPAYWEGMKAQGLHIRAEMVFENKIGVLKSLTEIFFLMRINIDEMSAHTDTDGLSHIVFSLKTEEEDYYLFERLMERVKLSIGEFKEGKLLEMK